MKPAAAARALHAPARDATDAWSATLRAPFATLAVRTQDGAVTEVAYLARDARIVAPRERIAERAIQELRRYLDDPEFRFSVPLAPRGTPFQQRVWDAIAAIPRGESRTYLEVARSVASAARAVGQACGANRIALIIPCHRVVGTRGALGGFMHAAAGDPIAIKRWLLAHEGYRFGLF
ncbi:MAG TPA: methylated-DNA--[protein]-cysteine S-methyltransferase [Casimicrobiaceae bacterium]|nr:methylated-DNA--[protein]-cysteine S-methyltransferase [Casimicrobiaceae bacterium]